jgi:uncharacterized protein
MSKNKKEEICNQCGKCCYIKTMIGDEAIFTRTHCEHLDTKSNLCKVYKNRFEKKPGCLSIEKAIEIRAVPDNCPYVQGLKNYKGPRWIDD